MGEFILKIKTLYKRFICVHDYEPIETFKFTFLKCRKCGKIKFIK